MTFEKLFAPCSRSSHLEALELAPPGPPGHEEWRDQAAIPFWALDFVPMILRKKLAEFSCGALPTRTNKSFAIEEWGVDICRGGRYKWGSNRREETP